MKKLLEEIETLTQIVNDTKVVKEQF